jgi:Trypsin
MRRVEDASSTDEHRRLITLEKQMNAVNYPLYCDESVDALCSTGSTLYNYGFADFAGFPNTHDLGLVILDEPIHLDTYASPAAADGSLDELAAGPGKAQLTFTVSGYGVSGVKPVSVSYRQRLMATVELINLHNQYTASFNLQLTANPGGGKGGTCFGNSGGPILYDDTDVIVAVNSFVLNGQCGGTSFAYRVDQADAIVGCSAQSRALVPTPCPNADPVRGRYVRGSVSRATFSASSSRFSTTT